jgi:peptide/nickel transport system permease protein
MTSFIIRRLIQSVLVVILVTAIVFLTMRLLPGDPLLVYLSHEQFGALSEEQIELKRHEFGLDKPVILQYTDWLGNLLHGDMGKSIAEGKRVSELIGDRIPVTLYLGVIAFVVGNALGIVAGMICALKRGKAIDLIVTLLANFGITVPIFWLGIILIYIFSLKIGWLPTHGFTPLFDDPWLSIKQTILPVSCLSIFSLAALARQTRSVMLEVVRQDYVRTAWSKGLSEHTVIMRHVIKNGMIPVITLSGMQLSHILGGSVITESVFNISGMGRLAVSSVHSLDYPVTQAIVLISAIMVTLTNLIVDISYGWLDPRVRYD